MARPTRRERDRRATEAAQASTAQSPAGTPRAGRRSRRVTQQGQRGFIDRYGGLLLLGFTILGVAVLLAVFVQSSTKTAYGCDSLLTPGPVEPVPAASSATQPSPGPTLAPDASPTPEPTPLPAPTQRLGFPVGDDQPRKVTLYGTKSHDYGIVRWSINGQPAGNDYDAYSAQAESSGAIELGTANPKDGKLVLRVNAVGANASSKGARYFFGLDCIVLSKPTAKPPTPSNSP